MSNYYFLATLVPELTIEEPPEIDFKAFLNLLEDNLSKKDFEEANIIRRYYDLMNLRAFWKGEPLDPVGKLDELELEEAFATQSGLPSYVFKFVEKYGDKESRLQHFPELLVSFFNEETKETSSFLRKFLQLERDLRLVLLGFRAKKLGRDLIKELQFEDPEDPLVSQIIAQKDAPGFEPPEKYENLKGLFEKHYQEPLELHKALLGYQKEEIESFVDLADRFSLNRVLAYMVELILVEKWHQLDKQKGLEVVDTILKDAT